MMPLAPQLSVPHIGQISASPITRNNMKASKPKLSFSIDSIVGKRKLYDTEQSDQSATAVNNLNEQAGLLAKTIKRHLSESIDLSDRRSNSSPNSAGNRSPDISQQQQQHQHHQQTSLPHHHHHNHHHRQSVSPLSNGSMNQSTMGGNVSPIRSPSPLSLVTTNGQSPNHLPPNNHNNSNNTTIPGQFLNRPPLTLPSLGSQSSGAGQMPQVAPLGHPNHPMMVAAAAAAAAASSAHQFPPMPSDYQQAAAFYPWFLRANPFAGRFPGMPFDSPLGSFLLPPFRKPKRIRTAFSPGQLLKLEQAFEKNHYVVGNERKQLANHLGLSETQVKVWFQNRRTKHKRQKQEDEESGSGSVTNGENGSANKDYSDDDEEIDLEEDEESISDQEHENGQANAAALNSFANMHHLWYQSMSAGLVPDNTPVSSSHST